MAITTAEYEAALEAAEREMMRRATSGGSLRRISHQGATTSREKEYQVLSMAELKQQINWLQRKLGTACKRTPLYP